MLAEMIEGLLRRHLVRNTDRKGSLLKVKVVRFQLDCKCEQDGQISMVVHYDYKDSATLGSPCHNIFDLLSLRGLRLGSY